MTISPALLCGGDPTAKAAGIRRRMNPESLAVRLGPGLIMELEALLLPGMKEMPSFSVRQAIQQRHNIDRRHIYDWFHNKGLRVASSEQREERRIARARADGIGSEKVNICFGIHACMRAFGLTDTRLRGLLEIVALPMPAVLVKRTISSLQTATRRRHFCLQLRCLSLSCPRLVRLMTPASKITSNCLTLATSATVPALPLLGFMVFLLLELYLSLVPRVLPRLQVSQCLYIPTDRSFVKSQRSVHLSGLRNNNESLMTDQPSALRRYMLLESPKETIRTHMVSRLSMKNKFCLSLCVKLCTSLWSTSSLLLVVSKNPLVPIRLL